jgi:trehalose/maltose hydrolase-like predicted phosphorylase
LRFRLAGGPWFDIADADVLEDQLELNLRTGVLARNLRWQDPDGRRTSMAQRRIVSMKDPHLAMPSLAYSRAPAANSSLCR